MIIRMARVRIAGPRPALEATLAVLQDVGALHVVPATPSARGEPPAASAARLAAHLERILADVERSLALLGEARRARGEPPAPEPPLPAAARFARRIRRKAEKLEHARSALEDERMLLLRYRAFFEAFESFAGPEARYPGGRAFYLVLRPGAQDAAADLERSLEAAVAGKFELRARALAGGELIEARAHGWRTRRSSRGTSARRRSSQRGCSCTKWHKASFRVRTRFSLPRASASSMSSLMMRLMRSSPSGVRRR